ncbi:MAG: ABC transporter permease [Planctomycetota bacterium]
MQKILTIARREYQAMVATKGFLIGLAMMPIMMMGGSVLPGLLQGIERPEDRKIIVIDGTGQLFDSLKQVAESRNQTLVNSEGMSKESSISGPSSTPLKSLTREEQDDKNARKAMGMEDIHRYQLESLSPDGFNDEKRLELSEMIREEQLYAFVEIPGDILNPSVLDLTKLKDPKLLELPEITYVAQDSTLSDAKRWIEMSLNQLIRARRLADQGVAPTVLLELEKKAPVNGTGLYFRDDTGSIVSKEKPSELASVFLPMGIMMLMFMIVMMSAQPMLESVLEEKTLRISEVLLGSANARQLMTGKLLGNVAGSLTVFALYAGGGLIFANTQGYADSIPYRVLPWFLVYQILAVLLFSSIFMAIAASVSQLREAQSLLLPVWMVMLFPMFVWFNVVREPNSSLATFLSFFPPSTPLMMTLRLSTGAIIPAWQILLSVVVLIAGTCVGVIAAARIYRIGILWQGKTPRLNELVMWVIRNPIS